MYSLHPTYNIMYSKNQKNVLKYKGFYKGQKYFALNSYIRATPRELIKIDG